MDLNLLERVILVTGGGRGIGRAIAKACAQEGARVVVAGRGADALRETVAELEPGRADWIACDVSDPGQVRAMIEEVVARHGRLDGVVNNAGRFAGGPLADLTPEALREGVDTKVIGALAVVQAALPALRQSDQARVVNIGGVSAQRVTPGAAVTAIANSGMNTLTAYLARELAADGITVNCVIPGYILTPPWQARAQALAETEGLTQEAAEAAILQRQDMGHSRWGQDTEIAWPVVFLLSAQARFINGAAFRVDGGQFLAIQR
jgi:NAD(P)-dependent dehydrogenase (short-subunit alcohol dehydrogenase family)